MKRVLLVIPNLDFGGAQNSFWRVSLLLANRYTMKLVAFNRQGLAPQPHGGDLQDLNVPGGRSWVSKLYFFFQRVFRLRQLKREFHPDVSISFLEGADYVNLLSSVGERILFYVHGSKMHDRNVSGFLGWVRKQYLIPAFYKRADGILVVNKRIEEEFKYTFDLASVPFHWLPNFYDFQKLNELSREPVGAELENFFANHQVICIMGRLAEEKGVDRFLRLMPQLLKRKPQVRLVLVGNGPDEEKLIAIASELGLPIARTNLEDTSVPQNARVVWTGYQANPYRFLGRSMILALPSRNEGMPNSLVEAMGLGVPVVASHCPYGPAELLSPSVVPPVIWPQIAESGILVPIPNNAKSEDDWLEALDMMLSDSSLRSRLRDAGLAFANRFSVTAASERWHKLLESSL